MRHPRYPYQEAQSRLFVWEQTLPHSHEEIGVWEDGTITIRHEDETGRDSLLILDKAHAERLRDILGMAVVILAELEK